jgi:hypothetical protein
VGFALLQFGIVTDPTVVAPEYRHGLDVLFWDVTTLGLVISVPILGIALFCFYAYFIHPPQKSFDLMTVHSQRVHDTGGLAREAAVDAALRDEDEGDAITFDFDE